ncbi:MAG: DHA2 family efflux MFS transporter permease subunit [Chloroflexi bacterium]|nr:DHA2 family efflux MFS transporter permease subunit [Chloroflexota bacterium]
MTTHAIKHSRELAGNRAGLAVGPRHAYIVFATVAVALLMSSLDSTIVAVSLPTMLSELNTDLPWLSWSLTGYLFSQSIIMPVAGKLSDRLGPRRVFLFSVILFTASSAAAGLAPNVYLLILFRVLQGIGGGAFMPSVTGVVCDMFGNRRASAIGLLSSFMPMGAIIGPNLGGIIIDHVSWRWVFFVNVPIGAVVLALGILLLPRSKCVAPGHSIDVTGAGLLSGAVLAILYGMTNLAENHGEFGLLPAVMFSAGAVLLSLFIRHEVRVANPIIELRVLRTRPFIATNVYNFVLGAAMFGVISFIPYYAMVAYGMTAGQSGILLTPRSVAVIVFSTASSFCLVRFRYRKPMLLGLITLAISLILLSRGYRDSTMFGFGVHDVLLLSLILGITGVGMGVANPASNNAVLDLMPDKAAEITGVRGMFRTVGGVFGGAAVVLALSRFQDKALGMQTIYLSFGVLLLLLIPLVFMIPDSPHARSEHRRRHGAGPSGGQ